MLDVPHKLGTEWKEKGTVIKTRDVSTEVWDELVENIDKGQAHYVVDPKELKGEPEPGDKTGKDKKGK